MAKKKTPPRPPNVLSAAQVYRLALGVAQNHLGYKGVDPPTLARVATAVAKKESTFNANAQNPGSSARGLMQLVSSTQASIEKKLSLPPAPDRAFEPAYALLLGCNYLAQQYLRYGRDWDKAVIAYNQGSYPGKKRDGQQYRAAVWSQYQSIPFNSIA